MRSLHRYSFIIAALALLWFPLLAGLAGLDLPAWPENRPPPPAPTDPQSLTALRAWPAQADAWVERHFGGRNWILATTNHLRLRWLGEWPGYSLALGPAGDLFLLDPYNRGAAIRPDAVCPSGPARRRMLSDIDQKIAILADALPPQGKLVLLAPKIQAQQDRMPRWFAEWCRKAGALEPDMAHPRQSDRVIWAGAWMASSDGIFDPLEFHWRYEGAAIIAQHLAGQYLGVPVRNAIPWRAVQRPGDLTGFTPGIAVTIADQRADFPSTGILACRQQPDCFPEFSDIAAVLGDVTRIRAAIDQPPDQRRPRLVMFSDSFGQHLAEGLAAYYAEIWHFSFNNANHLTPDQIERLHRIALKLFDPDQVILVLNMAAISVGNHPRTLSAVLRGP